MHNSQWGWRSEVDIRQKDRMSRLFSRWNRWKPQNFFGTEWQKDILFSRWNHGKAQKFWDCFLTTSPLRGTPPKNYLIIFKRRAMALRAFYFGQKNRRTYFFFIPVCFIPSVAERFFTTSSLRASYGEARNRVPASRHTLLAHSWALRGSPIHCVAGGEFG